jgi:hypothetical protein
MKIGIGHHGWVLACLLWTGVAANGGMPSRSDTNPALVYWQAFDRLPALGGADAALLRESPDADEEETSALARRFDETFALLRRAVDLKSACDWGADPGDGPSTFVPPVPRIRTILQAARLRGIMHLDRGEELECARELRATLQLGRHAAVDGSLMIVMIQVSVEERIAAFVAAHLNQFHPPALGMLAEMLTNSPAHVPVEKAVEAERRAFLGWFLAQIQICRAEHPGEELKHLGQVWSGVFPGQEFPRIVEAAGGTLEGLRSYAQALEPVYEEAKRAAGADLAQYQRQQSPILDRVRRSGNRIAAAVIPDFDRARIHELEVLGQLRLLQAAILRKTAGEAAFLRLGDPYGSGPIQLRRSAEGTELRSTAADHGFNVRILIPGTP